MTEVEIEELVRKLAEDHGSGSQQVRSVNDSVNESNEIRDEVRNIVAA